jgi:CRP-like cAMP-binding protein
MIEQHRLPMSGHLQRNLKLSTRQLMGVAVSVIGSPRKGIVLLRCIDAEFHEKSEGQMNWEKLTTRHDDSIDKRQTTTDSGPVFSPVLSEGFTRFPNLPNASRAAAGTILVEQSKRCSQVMLLLDGLVKLVSTNGDGKQVTVGLRSAGWYVGAAAVIMDTASVYSVVTVTPCSVVQIPSENFYFRLIQSARMMRHFIATISNETISLASAQAYIAGSSAEERLAQFMSERQGQPSQWRVVDTLPLLKQSELAQLLAISPEHLSRLLHKETSKPRTGRARQRLGASSVLDRHQTELINVQVCPSMPIQ